MVWLENLTEYELNATAVKRAVAKMLRQAGYGLGDVSLVLVGEQQMRDWNSFYRGKDSSTDVLSFAEKEAPKMFPHPEGQQFLGEIVVCPQVVAAQAKDYNVSFDEELFRVMVHGLLHLIGFDHEKDALSAELMQKAEKRYLELFLKK